MAQQVPVDRSLLLAYGSVAFWSNRLRSTSCADKSGGVAAGSCCDGALPGETWPIPGLSVAPTLLLDWALALSLQAGRPLALGCGTAVPMIRPSCSRQAYACSHGPHRAAVGQK